MLIYFLLLLIWMVLAVLFSGKGKNIDSNPKSKWRFCFWSSLFMALVMGLRGTNVGSDTPEYLNRFENSLSILTSEAMNEEPGYNYLNFLFNNVLGLSFNSLLFFTSLFICIVFASFVYHFSSDSFYSYFLHLTIGLFTMSMSGIRQSLAISFCFIALILVYKKSFKLRYVFAVLLVLVGYTFHNSAFFFLPFVLIPRFRISKKIIVLGLILSFSLFLFNDVIAQFFIQYVPMKYQSLELDANYHANILVYVIPVVVIIFCLLSIKTDSNGKYDQDISLMFVFLILNFMFMVFMPLNNQIGRISFYFINSYVILIPYAIKSVSVKSQSALKAIVTAVCIAYFIIGTIGGTLAIDNYYFYWQKPLLL